MSQSTVTLLVRDMLSGQRLALARLISKVENRDKDLSLIMKELYPKTGTAHVVGITGPPGAGKSTMVDKLAHHFRNAGKKVGIIAVDPSSPFSGGAVLGDRIRMQSHSGDEGVYIRSLGTRGKHGGLSHATKEVVMILDSAGFDLILVETAGVGQTELEILKLAQTVLVILVPESGDGIQIMKAGLIEIADVFAINKSDRPDADKILKELITMIGMSDHSETSWIVPVIKTQAIHDDGISHIVKSLNDHLDYLIKSGTREVKEKAFLKDEVVDILTEKLTLTVAAAFDTESGKEVIDMMYCRTINPYEAADIISK